MKRISFVALTVLLVMLLLAACGKEPEPEFDLDYGTSQLYTHEEMDEAILLIHMEFVTWDGCELHAIRYAGDEACTEENLQWLNELAEAREQELHFTQCIEFLSDFHSPVEESEADAWNHDYEYTDFQWWLGRTADGQWHLVTWGY